MVRGWLGAGVVAVAAGDTAKSVGLDRLECQAVQGGEVPRHACNAGLAAFLLEGVIQDVVPVLGGPVQLLTDRQVAGFRVRGWQAGDTEHVFLKPRSCDSMPARQVRQSMTDHEKLLTITMERNSPGSW